MKEVLIGFDIGTTSAKGAIFDVDGRTIMEATEPYPVDRPKPGWVEQDPQIWWTAIRKLSRDLMSCIETKKANLCGIGITHQRLTFVPVDKNCKPVYPAILWNDVRCSEEAKWVASKLGAQRVFRETGCPPGLWSVYKILWLKRNEPSVFRQIWKILLVPDYITLRLTGNLATTQSAAALTGALDVEALNRWHVGFLEALDLPISIFVTPILAGCQVAGKVTQVASSETGLPEGTPVVTAAGDQPCGSLGAGLIGPGKVAINGGTSCTTELICGDSPPPRQEPYYFLEVSPTGQYIVENSVYSGGSALMNWFKDTFGVSSMGEKRQPAACIWDAIYGLANDAPPGAEGMVLVPFFGGAGAPYWDLEARGAIVGVSLDHNRAHFVRAIMEGLAFEVRRSIALLQKAIEGGVAEILMYGGSSRSREWNQIFADVLGLPVTVPMTAETTALGAAMCASVGVGVHPSLNEAVRSMVHIKEKFTPDSRIHSFYEAFYRKVYDGLYDNLVDKMKTATHLIRNSGISPD